MTVGVTTSEALPEFLLTFSSVAEALAFASSPGAASSGVLVYNPGGVAGGNVYTTWATLKAALIAAGTRGCTVFVVGAAGVIDSATDLAGVRIVAGQTSAAFSKLSIANGVALTGFPMELVNVTLTGLSTGAPHYTELASGENILLRGTANLEQAGAGGVLVGVPAGQTFSILTQDQCSVFGNATGPVVALLGAGAIVITNTVGNSTVGANAIGGAPGTTWAARQFGTFTGAQLPQALFTGTLQWSLATQKHLFFAGSCAAASLIAGCFLPMGNPVDAAPPAAPFSWPIAEQHRFQRLVVRVLSDAAAVPVDVQFLVNSVIQAGLTVTVPAGSAPGTIIQGPRINAAASNGAAIGATAVIDVRCTGPGALGALNLQVTLEYV